jgi:hypothetical protein
VLWLCSSGKDAVLAAFRALDQSGSGKVSGGDLTAILANSGEKLSEAEIKSAVGKYGGGDVPYQQLVDDIFASVRLFVPPSTDCNVFVRVVPFSHPIWTLFVSTLNRTTACEELVSRPAYDGVDPL